MEREGVYGRVRRGALIFLIFGWFAAFAQLPVRAAGRVNLAWDASADPNVAGYLINYGVASGTYTNAVAVGNVTSATISNLVEGTTYFFAAKAYDSANVQSDFSNEASYSVPMSVNQPPTLGTLGNLTLGEDAGLQTVDLSGIGSGAADENQTLTVTAASSNTDLVPNPTVTYLSPNATGTLSFTPVPNANGTATITVTVNDGGASNNIVTRTFTVTVNAVNDVPTLDALNNLTINEDAGVQTVNLSGIASGAANETQTLTVTATSGDANLIPNPTVTYTSPNATGTLLFKPVAYAFGTATVTVTVNDGGASNNLATRIFTVTVNPVNQSPTLNAINNVTINEGAGLQTVDLAGITSGMTNEDQTLTVTAVSSNPSLIPNPTVEYTSANTTGALSFAPMTYAYGTATITVTVNDGWTNNSTFSRTFTVTVKSVNQPPTLDEISDLTIVDGQRGSAAQTISLTGITSGAPNENQKLTVTAVSSNPGLIPNPTVKYTSPKTNGTMSFTPVAGAYGTARLTVTVADGGASNNVVTRAFTVVVSPPNQPPTLEPIDALALRENAGGQTVSLSGITSGSTNEFQTLTVTAVSSNPELIPNPTVNYTSPNPTGNLSFTPATDTFGDALITVTVNDGQAANNSFSRTFWVGVDASVAQLSIGSTVLQAGQSGSVPLNFSSSEGVIDLSIVLEVPAGHLTNLALQALAPEINPASATLVPQSSTTTLLHLAAKPGQSILGSKQLGQMAFTAIANQQSTFVPLKALPFSATKADGSPLTNRPAQSGRAVVVGKEALLEGTLDASGNRVLILYGKPSATFAIEYTTSLSNPRTWTRLSPGFSLTTLATPVPLPNPSPDLILYRAAQLSAAP